MQPQNQNVPQQPAQTPQPAQAPTPVPVAPQDVQPPAPQPQQQPPVQAEEEAYEMDDQEYEQDDVVDLSEPVTWQAKEYVHHEKSGSWFAIFGIVFAAFMALAIFLMQSWTFAVLLVVIAVVIVVLAKRPPRLMSYSLSEKGLHIGDTLHAFADFRAFGVIHDGQEYSIMLIPTKRFLPGVTVYFPEESGEEIVDALGSRLPMKELRLDMVDRIVRKLRLG